MTRLGPAPTAAPRIERRGTPPVDPVALCTAVATAYLEVRAGRRPPDQLRPLLAPRARRRIHALVRRRRCERMPSGGVSVSHVSTCWPHERAVEVVVVLRDSRGVTAVAARADHRRGRWWVTDVGAPEDRRPLLPPGAALPAPKAATAGVRIRDTS